MDLSQLFDSLLNRIGATLPTVLGAVAILLIGWLVAVLARAATLKFLGLIGVNRRLQSTTGTTVNVETGAAVVLYYLILLLALIAFFNALHLERASSSLQSIVDQVFAFLPRLIAGGVLLLLAWVLASLLRTVVTAALRKTALDEKLAGHAGIQPVGKSIGNVLFWLVMLLFLPAVLGALELEGLLAPVQGMMDRFLQMLPNVFGALVLGVAGWFLARILRDLVTNLLTAAGADRIGERIGLSGTMTLSRLTGLVVYVFVFVPALIAALDALAIESISKPATGMLQAFMTAVPNIFAAALILAVAWFVSGFVAGLLSSLLGGLGFDTLPKRLGLKNAFQGELTASVFAGRVLVFFVMLFAAVEATDQLGFGAASQLVATLLEFGGQVLLGATIIGVGFWLSSLAHRALTDGGAAGAASIVRFAILGLVLAMGLRAMGLADDIVNLAFGLTLGAIAVAVALSFGLGGREAAGKQMEHWLARMRK